jgi:hypothetical protein
MLFAIDLYKDFINVECIAVASMLAFQSACINGAELDTPETDCLSADGDATFSEEVFDISMAEIDSIVEPDSIGNDVGREAVALVCIHRRILVVTAG